jgi:hypothetical protein
MGLICNTGSLYCAPLSCDATRKGHKTLAEVNRNLDQRTVELLSSSLKTSEEKPPKQAKGGSESAMDSSLEDQLAKAKASRNQAESARQKIANEILEATKEACQKLIKDGEQTLEKAKKLEAEAQHKQREAKAELEQAQASKAEAETYAERLKSEAQRQAQEKLEQAQAIRAEADAYRERVMAEVQQQAQEQLDQAQNIRHEADAYREKVISEAKEQGQEILYLARSAAEQECNEMKRQVSLEAQRTIAESELIKAASQEELEAQRIYAETARLEAESLEVLAQVRAKLGETLAAPQPGAHVASPVLQANTGWQSVNQADEPLPASEVEPESATESQEAPAPEEPASKSPKSKRSRFGSR